MLRIINLSSLFARLTPELTRRLQRSPFAQWQGNLLIVLKKEDGSDEAVMLAIDAGQVIVAPATETAHTIRGGQAIAQLVLGTESPDEVLAMAGIEVSGAAAQLLPVLFSAQYPQMENQAL